jgi:8-oxo-dGTP diphosphatase
VAKLYLVRHADAGDRSSWPGADRDRPLSAKGERQAAGLAEALAHAGVARLLASPFVRCVQTLEPLAAQVGLTVEPDPRLAEGAGAALALEAAAECRSEPAAFCSHGDVIPDVLEALLREGLKVKDDLRWQKASTWVLTWDGDRLTKGKYLPPPH